VSLIVKVHALFATKPFDLESVLWRVEQEHLQFNVVVGKFFQVIEQIVESFFLVKVLQFSWDCIKGQVTLSIQLRDRALHTIREDRKVPAEIDTRNIDLSRPTHSAILICDLKIVHNVSLEMFRLIHITLR